MNVSAFETSEYIIVITKICILIESQNLEEIRWASNILIIISLSLSLFEGRGILCGHADGIFVPQLNLCPCFESAES